MVVVGRAIQGAGAISAALIALSADLTQDENRTKSMAIIGMTIGATFIVSMVAGPVLSGVFGVPGIFALTGVLALLAMLVVRFVVPDPPASTAGDPALTPSTIMDVLRDRQLARLNFGIFSLHGVLMAMFVVVPVELLAQLAEDDHWKMYLGVMLASVAIMLPVMLLSERRGQQKAAFLGSVAVIGASALLLEAGSSVFQLMVGGLVLFFAAFNLLEAMLPSLVSRVAPSNAKGTAIGVYSTLQFLGTFVGATAGGWVAQQYGNIAVFGMCAFVAGVWLVVAMGMQVPQRPGRPATSA
jgi:predicted MFS family arabinose efflux permease